MDIHTLDNPITIIHKDDTLLSSVKDDLRVIINTFYDRDITHKITLNNIILEINTILGLYNLQLITKKCIKFFRPGKYYYTFSLLIHPSKKLFEKSFEKSFEQPKHESLLAYLGISDDEEEKGEEKEEDDIVQQILKNTPHEKHEVDIKNHKKVLT
jgi:hypothetical protein